MATTIGYKMTDGRRLAVFNAVKEYCKRDSATGVIDFAMETTATTFNLLVVPPVYRIAIKPEVVDPNNKDSYDVYIDKDTLLELLQRIYPNSTVGFDFDVSVKTAKMRYSEKYRTRICAQVMLENGAYSVADSEEVTWLIRLLQAVKRGPDNLDDLLPDDLFEV